MTRSLLLILPWPALDHGPDRARGLGNMGEPMRIWWIVNVFSIPNLLYLTNSNTLERFGNFKLFPLSQSDIIWEVVQNIFSLGFSSSLEFAWIPYLFLSKFDFFLKTFLTFAFTMLIHFEILWAQVHINEKVLVMVLLSSWTILVHIFWDVIWNTNGVNTIRNFFRLVLNLGVTPTFLKHPVICFVYF